MVARHDRVDRMAGPHQHRRQRQQIYPQSATGEECLAHFEADDRSNLRPPQAGLWKIGLLQIGLLRIGLFQIDHWLDSSPPIRYSYTELTLSSAGATLSISIPFMAMW